MGVDRPTNALFPVQNGRGCQLSKPILSEGHDRDLRIESTLADLPLYAFEADVSCPAIEVARTFEQYPLLPGVILTADGQFVGTISRDRLLEYLIRPQGLELFLERPLSVLHSYARSQVLLLPEQTPILEAARRALRRSPQLQGEPLVVKGESDTYRLLNVHELNVAHWQIRGIETQVRIERLQAQMIQTEKMASLGRLVDGLAHEILDPVGFIWGNLSHVSRYSEELMELVSAYEEHFEELPAEIEELKEDIEFDFLQQDRPRAISSIQKGAERLKKLVTSLQNFCHIDDVYPKPADLHECIDSVLLLLQSRLSGEIEVVRHYCHLPPVQCYAGQLSQVFMNILTNAIDSLIAQALNRQFAREFGQDSAIAPSKSVNEKPRIEITTEIRTLETGKPDTLDSRWVVIAIADNGPGIAPQKRQQLLDSFAAPTQPQKETSLSVSHRIVTAKHGGKFYLRSRTPQEVKAETPPGDADSASGTEFEIWLPL